MPSGCFQWPDAVAAMLLIHTGHKISSRLWGCCFVPLVSFDVANISLYFYSCKIFSNKLCIFSEIRSIRSRKILCLIDAVHQSLQVVDVLLFHRRCCLDVFLVEGERKPLFRFLPFRITHRETTHISTKSKELIFQDVATAVALYYSPYFPKLQVVQKHMAVYSYLTYEQLIDVVGVC